MKDIVLGKFTDNRIKKEIVNIEKKNEIYDEEIVSYKDDKTNELVIKFVRKPIKKKTK